MIKELVKRGNDPKIIDHSGNSLLMCAAINCEPYVAPFEIFKYLIEQGADAKIICHEGKNVLMKYLKAAAGVDPRGRKTGDRRRRRRCSSCCQWACQTRGERGGWVGLVQR